MLLERYYGLILRSCGRSQREKERERKADIVQITYCESNICRLVKSITVGFTSACGERRKRRPTSDRCAETYANEGGGVEGEWVERPAAIRSIVKKLEGVAAPPAKAADPMTPRSQSQPRGWGRHAEHQQGGRVFCHSSINKVTKD